MTTETDTGPWLFVGAGNMARAIIAGASKAGAMRPETTAWYSPDAEPGDGVGSVFRDPAEAGDWLAGQGDRAAVVIATKPQMFPDVARVWGGILGDQPPRLVVSILAGTSAATIAAGLGRSRVVRVMPNTPISLGMGMSAVAQGPNATDADVDRVETLFASVGKALRIDEGMMDAFTGVAGSGPAYVFYLADAMREAAEQLGFDREQALTLVRQTVSGAGALLASSPDTPRALRSAVTSRGGTTAAATDTMDEAGVHDAIVRAVHAARHRGAELGKG